MHSNSRRGALRTLAFLALAPGLAGVAPVRAQTGNAIEVPTGRFRLRRELVRGLANDARLVVTRDWEIAFTPLSHGARVDGHQVLAQVDAPEALAPLAEVERSRAVTGFLPALLDGRGWLLAAPGGPQCASLEHAVAVATRLAAVRLPAAERPTARAYLAQVGATAGEQVSAVPPDLFFPESGETRASHALPEIDGEVGRVEVVVTTACEPATRLLSSYRRSIVTHLGDSVRVASETWTLDRT